MCMLSYNINFIVHIANWRLLDIREIPPDINASQITEALFHPDFIENSRAAERGEIGLKEMEERFLVFCQKLVS